MDPYFKLMGEALAHQMSPIIQIAGGNAGDALGGPCRLLPDCAIDRRAQTNHIAFDDWIETILERLHDVGSDNANRLCPAASMNTFNHSSELAND